MSKLRVLAFTALLAVLVLGVVAWRLLGSLDARIARIIEREGSLACGAPVHVRSVHVSLRQGSGVVRGLRISNPEGFSRHDALTFGEIRLTLELGSLRQGPIVVSDVTALAPVARMELDGRSRSNLDVLSKSASRQHGGAGSASVQRLLRIVRFHLDAGRIDVDASALGQGTDRIDLRPIDMRNVGGAAGQPVSQVTDVIVQAVTHEVARAAESRVMRGVVDRVGGGVGGKLKGIFGR